MDHTRSRSAKARTKTVDVKLAPLAMVPVPATRDEKRHQEAFVQKLERHLATLKLDAQSLRTQLEADLPMPQRWLVSAFDELPLEPVEPDAEADKILSLEEADDIVSWALDHWQWFQDLEVKPPKDHGYPVLIKSVQDRIVSTDGIERAIIGQMALFVIPRGRSMVLEASPVEQFDRGKLKLMRYIVVLSLPEPNAVAIDGQRLGVQPRTVFRYFANKTLRTRPVQSQQHPLTLLSFLIHVPQD